MKDVIVSKSARIVNRRGDGCNFGCLLARLLKRILKKVDGFILKFRLKCGPSYMTAPGTKKVEVMTTGILSYEN